MSFINCQFVFLFRYNFYQLITIKSRVIEKASGFLRDRKMDDNLTYIYPHAKHNYPFCRFKLSIEKFGTNKSKFKKKYPKFLSQQIRKLCQNKTLGIIVINSPMSHIFLERHVLCLSLYLTYQIKFESGIVINNTENKF